jgi:type VI secretion system secreted protein Hcp
MAVDMFLIIDGITGGSTNDRHRGAIEVLGYSWGANQSGMGTARAAGKPSFADLVVSCSMSRASPELWIACVSGRRLASAALSCAQSGAGPQEFFRLELEDVIITSYQSTGTGEDRPLDQVSLAYQTIRSTFTGIDKTGKPESPVTAGWDLKKNTKA